MSTILKIEYYLVTINADDIDDLLWFLMRIGKLMKHLQ